MHNTGVGYDRTMGLEPATVEVQLAPGVFVEVDPEVYRASAEKPAPDLGYYESPRIRPIAGNTARRP